MAIWQSPANSSNLPLLQRSFKRLATFLQNLISPETVKRVAQLYQTFWLDTVLPARTAGQFGIFLKNKKPVRFARAGLQVKYLLLFGNGNGDFSVSAVPFYYAVRKGE